MKSKSQPLSDFDPFSASTLENPYPFFAALRREAPVFNLEQSGFTMISRYEDVRAAALDTETFSSSAVSIIMKGKDGAPSMLSIGPASPRPVDVLALADPPTHTRQRMLVNKMFTGRQVINLRPSINRLANELFNEISTRSDVEWMEGFANALPMQLILEIVGFPTEDAEQLTRWAGDTLDLITKIQTPESMAINTKSTAALGNYLAKLLVLTKADPGKDMLGTLALATRSVTEAITDREAMSIAFQLLSAGQGTTSSLLGSAVMMLAIDMGLQDELRHDMSLVPAFIEEVARLESPFIGHYRVTTRDTEIRGVPIAEGTRIKLLWGSANRDEEAFIDAAVVDLWREDIEKHLAFGVGPHHCIGAPIARLEAQITLEGLLDRSRHFELANPNAKLSYLQSPFLRSLTSLPLCISWR